ncbi:MAG: hypothetical protein LC733_04055 [Actinobacteria bacterium]|nr:hypothetical protein [Actinomycetota bacterium]
MQVIQVSVPGTTTGHQWLSRSGGYTFVATEGTGRDAGVAVIDNPSATFVTHYAYPGGGRPHGVLYDPLPPNMGS